MTLIENLVLWTPLGAQPTTYNQFYIYIHTHMHAWGLWILCTLIYHRGRVSQYKQVPYTCQVEGQFISTRLHQIDRGSLMSFLQSTHQNTNSYFILTYFFFTFTMVEFTVTSQFSSPCMGQTTLVYNLVNLYVNALLIFYGFHDTSWNDHCPMTPSLVATLTIYLQGHILELTVKSVDHTKIRCTLKFYTIMVWWR